MDAIKQHFNDEARKFDEIILILIPDYLRMVTALVAALPFARETQIRVVDLGCGTGTIAKAILEAFPNALVTCIDLAENMVAVAKSKLAAYAGVEYIIGDFASLSFNRTYDVVVSSLALHHLVTDLEKRQFYKRVFEALRSGGVFYNADVVLGSSEFLQGVYMREWRRFMSRNLPASEVDETWIPKYYAEDRPAKLMDQLDWLGDIGFADVDVLLKTYNFAVYGGAKKS